MKKIFVILSIFVLLCSCCDNSTICPVEYQIKTGTTLTLQRNWNLIGFLSDGATSINYPPCQGDYSYAPAPVLVLETAMTCGPMEDSTFGYSWGTSGLVNFCNGCYNFDGSNNITFEGGMCTEIGGPEAYSDYERKFTSALMQATHYEIHHNILTIYYNSNDRMLFVAKE